ncbi:MAG: cyclic nucleotide-binding domain-containing protein [Polyangia bacterium]
MVRLAGELLGTHPLLRGLDRRQLDSLQQAGELESWSEGEEVVRQGTLGDAMYLILSGTVSVYTGDGARALATLGPGDFFGEMSMIEPAVRSATVRADERLELFRIPNVAVTRFFGEDPLLMSRILVHVVRALSQRLRKTNELVGSVESLSEWLAGSLV